jgi:hypothetical protein
VENQEIVQNESQELIGGLLSDLIKIIINTVFENTTFIANETLDELLKFEKNDLKAAIVYLFLLKKSNDQKTNQPWANKKYVMKKLGMGMSVLTRLRGKLKERNLIEDIFQDHPKYKTGNKNKCFTKLPYKMSKKKLEEKIQKNIEEFFKNGFSHTPEKKKNELIKNQVHLSEDLTGLISRLNNYYCEPSMKLDFKFTRHKINKPGEKLSKTVLKISDYINRLQAGTFLKLDLDKLWLEDSGIIPRGILQGGKSLKMIENRIKKSIDRLHLTIKQMDETYTWPKSLIDFFYNPRSKKSRFAYFLFNEAWEGGQNNLQTQKKNLDNEIVQMTEVFFRDHLMKRSPGIKNQIALFASVKKLERDYNAHIGELLKYNQGLGKSLLSYGSTFYHLLECVFNFAEENWAYKKAGLITWGKGDGWLQFKLYMDDRCNSLLEITQEGIKLIASRAENRKREARENIINLEYKSLKNYNDENNIGLSDAQLYEQAVENCILKKSIVKID